MADNGPHDAGVWDALDNTDAPYGESSLRVNNDTVKAMDFASDRGRWLEARVKVLEGVVVMAIGPCERCGLIVLADALRAAAKAGG